MKKVTKICSPCENCHKKDSCGGGAGTCDNWKKWFRDYWRKLRHKYGMDKVVKK